MRYCIVDEHGIGRTRDERPSGDLLIADAVGPSCPNRRHDVLVVQSLLNVAYARVRIPPRTIPVTGIFGSETEGAILRFQRAQLGKADARIEPGGPTLARLNAVAAGPPRTIGSARAASTPSPRTAALNAASLARSWAGDARAHLARLLELPWPAEVLERLETVNVHFHLDREAAGARDALAKLADVYGRIEAVLDDAAKVFREGGPMAESPVVEAPLGALSVDDPALRTITFRPGFAACGPNTRAALILHSCAHFVGQADEIGHFALEIPAPEGAPHERGARNYRELAPAEALRNAPSYAAFAIHVATGSDQRFGARDIRL